MDQASKPKGESLVQQLDALTATKVVPSVSSWSSADQRYLLIAGMAAGGPSMIDMASFYHFPAKGVFINISAVDEEREVLKDAVKNLWRVYRFNQHYIGYLAGSVTAEDFDSVSVKYAQEPMQLPASRIQNAVRFLLPLIGDEELSPNELSVVLNTDSKQLELALANGGGS